MKNVKSHLLKTHSSQSKALQEPTMYSCRTISLHLVLVLDSAEEALEGSLSYPR